LESPKPNVDADVEEVSPILGKNELLSLEPEPAGKYPMVEKQLTGKEMIQSEVMPAKKEETSKKKKESSALELTKTHCFHDVEEVPPMLGNNQLLIHTFKDPVGATK
jgi:hypothetical protein